jgi:CRISPR-associated protein Cmr4
MQSKLLLVHALSPLHAGTGQGVGVIDLPIAREKATGIPFLPGSSIKGVLRDKCSADLKTQVFGPETANASDHAGSAQFTDARLLLLPVRSLAGTFAWVTSPLLLQRFRRDAADNEGLSLPTKVPEPTSEAGCAVAPADCELQFRHQGQQRVVLEDLLLHPTADEAVSSWADKLGGYLFPADADRYWKKALKARLCVVPDNVLSFLLQTATEITARIQLEQEKKTVKRGMLWYEEALPAETVLYGLVVASPVMNMRATEVFTTIADLTKATLQFGGSATVGRGLCQLRLIG